MFIKNIFYKTAQYESILILLQHTSHNVRMYIFPQCTTTHHMETAIATNIDPIIYKKAQKTINLVAPMVPIPFLLTTIM